MKNKKQIIFIRGGEAFYTEEQYYHYLKTRVKYNPFKKKKSWRDWITWALSKNFESMEPPMPCKKNAQYEAWKIFFEKSFEYLNDEELILIGSSLGGTFLVKYLSENNFPKKINQLHLVAPVFEDDGLDEEYLASFNFDPEKIKTIFPQVEKIFLYQSQDDPITSFKHFEKFNKIFKNFPDYESFVFKNRGHFSQPALPELLENINKNLK